MENVSPVTATGAASPTTAPPTTATKAVIIKQMLTRAVILAAVRVCPLEPPANDAHVGVLFAMGRSALIEPPLQNAEDSACCSASGPGRLSP